MFNLDAFSNFELNYQHLLLTEKICLIYTIFTVTGIWVTHVNIQTLVNSGYSVISFQFSATKNTVYSRFLEQNLSRTIS